MTSVQNILRAAVPAAALALLLTGCGPDNNGGPGGDAAAGPATGTPAATAVADPSGAVTGGGADGGSTGGPGTAAGSAAPAGADAAGAGTYASPLGASATGHYVGKVKADLTPVSLVKVGAADLAPLNIPAADLAGRTPYYLTMSFTNRSGATVADNYFMQRVRLTADEQDTGVLAAAVAPGRSAAACNAGAKAPSPADGQSQKSCSVYLFPAGSTPKFISYGSIMDDHPLVWKAS
ncbi:hypothetical protein [Kitasatospora sp. NBC_00315]|uniref:hypothetical protein n=1 Tax=Kitasatospora sp. NBC_00315 TaxID=2975963 RepID=UPI00324ACF7F